MRSTYVDTYVRTRMNGRTLAGTANALLLVPTISDAMKNWYVFVPSFTCGRFVLLLTTLSLVQHLNIRPHTCECCGKMFARLDALNRHHRQEGDTCVPPHAGLLMPGIQRGMHASVPMGMGSNEYAFDPHSTPMSSSLSSPGTAPMGTLTSTVGYMASLSLGQLGVQPHHRQHAGPVSIPQGHAFHHAPSIMGSAPHTTHGMDHLGMGLYTNLNDMPHHRMGINSGMQSVPSSVAPMNSVPAPSPTGVMGTPGSLGTPLPTSGPLSMPVEHGLLDPGPMDWNAGPLSHGMPNQSAWPQSAQRFAGHVL